MRKNSKNMQLPGNEDKLLNIQDLQYDLIGGSQTSLGTREALKTGPMNSPLKSKGPRQSNVPLNTIGADHQIAQFNLNQA